MDMMETAMNETNITHNPTSDVIHELLSVEEMEYVNLIVSIEMWQRISTIVLGSIGNSLSVIIFCSTSLRTLSSSYYLSALAISDTAFLLILFLAWLPDMGVTIYMGSVFCSLQCYLSYTFAFLSVWFVVAFTVERFIAVQYPLLRPSMCTVSRAKKVIAGLTICAFIMYLPVLWTEFEVKILGSTENPSCHSEINQLAVVFNAVDTVTTMLIPCVAIVGVNTCICITVSKLGRLRRRMTINSGRRITENGRSQNNSTRHNNAQNKVTRLLLVVSTVFVCLNIPNYIFRLFHYIPDLVHLKPLTVHILTHISLILYYTTFGINFVLYCITGQNFRKTMCSLCCPSMARPLETTRVTGASDEARVEPRQDGNCRVERVHTRHTRAAPVTDTDSKNNNNCTYKNTCL